MAEDDGGERESLAKQCHDRANELVAMERITPALQASAKRISGKSKQFLDEIALQNQREKEAAEAIESIQQLAVEPDRLAEALESFIARFPDHPFSRGFRQAIAAAPHWRAAVAWRDIRQRWGGTCRVSDPDVLAERTDDAIGYLASHHVGPLHGALRDYQRYLDKARAVLDQRGSKDRSGIVTTLKSPLLSGLLTVRMKNGRIYYVKDTDPVETRLIKEKRYLQFRYIINDKLNTSTTHVPSEEVDGGPAPAPQTRVAGEALDMVQEFEGQGWETLYLTLAERARAAKEMDPILQSILLRMFLTYASECSPAKEDAIREMIEPLEDMYLNVAWMNPGDKDAETIRKQAEQANRHIPPLALTIEAVERYAESFDESLRAYVPVGVLLGTQTSIDLPDSRQTRVILYAVASAEGRDSAFKKIGLVEDGKLKLDRAAVRAYPVGSLLFTRTESLEQPTGRAK